MNTIIDFFKRMFGLKPNRVTTVVTKKSKPEIENISKNHKRSDLNEISLKMNTGNSKPVVSETEKPKKKRYYKKKTANKEKTTEAKNETNKNTEKKPVNTEGKTNGTTKKRYRPKSLSKLQQFNLNQELISEFSDYMSNIGLDNEQADKMCSLVERIISQHYVRQILKQAYGK